LQALGQILAVIAPYTSSRMPLESSPIRASSAARRPALQSCRLRSRATTARQRARARPISLLDRRPSAGACEVVGILALGQQRKAKAFSRLEMRQRRSAARQAAFCPALSPSRQSIGSFRHLPQQRQLVSGQAVPSGATVAAKPAVTMR